MTLESFSASIKWGAAWPRKLSFKANKFKPKKMKSITFSMKIEAIFFTLIALCVNSAFSQTTQNFSDKYAQRIVSRVKPNIYFDEKIDGNPSAEVEVRGAPNGDIVSRRLIKSSGVESWDHAVLNAIDKTEKMPVDTNGHVPAVLLMAFSPKM